METEKLYSHFRSVISPVVLYIKIYSKIFFFFRKSFGATLVRRVRKASSDFINKVPSRNRRSWHEDSRLTQSQFTLGGGGSGESGGNDSDNSSEDPQRTNDIKRAETGSLHGIKPRDEIALRRSHRDLNQHRYISIRIKNFRIIHFSFVSGEVYLVILYILGIPVVLYHSVRSVRDVPFT